MPTGFEVRVEKSGRIAKVIGKSASHNIEIALKHGRWLKSVQLVSVVVERKFKTAPTSNLGLGREVLSKLNDYLAKYPGHTLKMSTDTFSRLNDLKR